MLSISLPQARQFILLKHGLIGEHKFIGKAGALAYIRQTGCLQFDPVDLCGQNAQITLNARVKGFTKAMLEELLYKDRLLFDYPDKNLAIIPVEYWPYFRRYRDAAILGGKRFEGVSELEAQALEYIRENGPINSDDLPLEGGIRWHSSIHWSGSGNSETKAARAVLEQLYSTGQLIVHHKKGTRKFYDLAENHISQEILSAPDPLPDEFEHQKWRVLRRIGAVGLLWNRPSDAWLYIQNLSASRRGEIFKSLLEEEKIRPVTVEGINHTLYIRTEDLPLLETIRKGASPKPRCELIAPLDCFMWDRKIILALFGFHYAWEIYTPPAKRKYGPYVLPILYGENFAGRIEVIRKDKSLVVKNIWLEDGVRKTKKLQTAVDSCLERFARFNNTDCIKTLSDDESNLRML
ncbi:MAG: winged helix DNA-binding domain-containing protein [Defluviitaleaceae bacterium]|nr:winged helix DNA-binding domain-containing protein [Defluviitaleaceae bacterium]